MAELNIAKVRELLLGLIADEGERARAVDLCDEINTLAKGQPTQTVIAALELAKLSAIERDG